MLATRSMDAVGLAMDPRAFDGAYAANFFVSLKTTLEGTDWLREL